MSNFSLPCSRNNSKTFGVNVFKFHPQSKAICQRKNFFVLRYQLQLLQLICLDWLFDSGTRNKTMWLKITKLTLRSWFKKTSGIIFIGSFSECADTEQIRITGSQSRIFGFNFDFTSCQMQESNQGRLDEKRERFFCAMPSPNIRDKKFSPNFQTAKLILSYIDGGSCQLPACREVNDTDAWNWTLVQLRARWHEHRQDAAFKQRLRVWLLCRPPCQQHPPHHHGVSFGGFQRAV